MWLYALLLVIFCLNHMVDPALAGGTQTPAGYASGTISDVSALLPFKFWQPVYSLQILLIEASQVIQKRKEEDGLESRKTSVVI